MKPDRFGQVALNEKEFFESLYRTKIGATKEILVNNSSLVDQFNQMVKLNGDQMPLLRLYSEPALEIAEFDKQNQLQWFIPKKYKDEYDIVNWLFDQCTTQEQKDRVAEELELFIQHEMYEVLVFLKYLVDVMRENKIVWGVGRGSSVSSYCLYLLGVHKIDSIRYGLDIHEFLK